jgi:hypothetical protein
VAGLKDFRDFAAWQRAEELRILCEAFLCRPGVRATFRRAQQLDDAAASAPRNIAEGFGRYKPKVFAQYVKYCKRVGDGGAEYPLRSTDGEFHLGRRISEVRNSRSSGNWHGNRVDQLP